jgi:hypothetical protein
LGGNGADPNIADAVAETDENATPAEGSADAKKAKGGETTTLAKKDNAEIMIFFVRPSVLPSVLPSLPSVGVKGAGVDGRGQGEAVAASAPDGSRSSVTQRI